MANIKSQIKRNRQNDRRRVRNKSVRSALKTSVKRARTAAEAGQDDAAQLVRTTTREIDRAVSKGVLHKKAAARRVSRLARAASSSR